MTTKKKPAAKTAAKPDPKSATKPKTPAPGPAPAKSTKPAAKRPAAGKPVQPPIPGIESVEPPPPPAPMSGEVLRPAATVYLAGGKVARVALLLEGIGAAFENVEFAVVVDEPAEAVAAAPQTAPPPTAPAPAEPAESVPGELDRVPPIELQVDVRYNVPAELDQHVAALRNGLRRSEADVTPADDDHDFATVFFECETQVEADRLAVHARTAPFAAGAAVVDAMESRLSDAELAELDARPRELFVSGEPRVYCSRCVAIGRAPGGLAKAAAATGMTCYNCGWPAPRPA